ncbi:MAG: hypothetical protein VX583_08205 [Bdellovibrionota bacterium]
MSRICDLEKTSGLGGDLFVGLVLGFWFFVEVLDKVGFYGVGFNFSVLFFE